MTAPTATIPRPPSHLKGRGRALFRDVARAFELAAHEVALLDAACTTLERLDEARAVIEAEGMTTTGSTGQLRPHPMLTVERDCRLALARLLRELGLEETAPADSRPPRIRGGRRLHPPRIA